MTKNYFYLVFVSLILFNSCESDIDHPLFVEGDGVFDIEGNYYKSVVIGNQEWMAENLKTDLYCNGDSIQHSSFDERITVYDNDLANENIYGKLYNFLAVEDTSGLCPCGWHIPTELEFAVLINYLDGFQDAMRKMKSTGSIENGDGLWTNPTDHWIIRGNNESGFNALPAGYRFYSNFNGKDSMTYFLALSTSDDDLVRFGITDGLPYLEKMRYTNPLAKEVFYYSIRCIKDI